MKRGRVGGREGEREGGGKRGVNTNDYMNIKFIAMPYIPEVLAVPQQLTLPWNS